MNWCVKLFTPQSLIPPPRSEAWIWRMFCWIKIAKLLSNNRNIWIQWDITQCLAQTQSFFIFWVLLALTTSLRTLLGSVWSFCHMLVNNIQGFTWIWSTCLGKVVPSVTTSCMWEHSWGQAVPVLEDENHCWSEKGDFSSGCSTLHRQILRIKEYFFPSGVIFPQPSF